MKTIVDNRAKVVMYDKETNEVVFEGYTLLSTLDSNLGNRTIEMKVDNAKELADNIMLDRKTSFSMSRE